MGRPGKLRSAATATVAAAALVPLLAAGPAQAQRVDAGKLAEERTAHIRDMLRFMALGARRAGAFTFGKVEATADRGLIRIHNAVIVLRRYPLVYSIRQIEIRDEDRTHFVPFKMNLRAIDAEAEMGTIPQFVRGMMLALGVKHTRTNFTLDYAYDQQKAALALNELRLQWNDYASVALAANFSNVPTPNRILALATAPASAEDRLKAIRLENWEARLINKSAHDVVYRSAAFIRREDAETFRKRTLAQFEERSKNAPTQVERDFWSVARTVISGPSIATATATVRKPFPMGQLQDMQTAKAVEEHFRVRFDADTEDAAAVDKAMPSPQPEPWNPQAAGVKDPPWHECDAAASAPSDSRRRAEPVFDANLDAIVGLAECKRAVMEYPAAPRFQFQYGRALWAADHQQAAREYLRKASDAGYAAATLLLARSFTAADSGSKRPEEAVSLLRKAEEQGSTEAKALLARAYLSGEGVERDVERGLSMLRSGGVEDSPLGKAVLADAYWNGWGETRDRQRALTLWQDAAERGVTSAQRRLADIYADGATDVGADPQKAYFWLRLLSNRRTNAIREKMREVRRKLPQEERQAIEERARKWRPKGA